MARFIKISILILLSTHLLYAQLQNIKFEHITMDDGLSGNFVENILQDGKGFMWICTRNGLNKYDGYKFTVYKHDENNPHSISINWIRFIYEDTQGQLWIGTNGGGLERFDRLKEKFIHHKHDNNNPNSICCNYVLTMHEDHNGDLWIGTGNGVSQLIRNQASTDSEKVRFINYKYDANNLNILRQNSINSIHEDKNRDLWVSMGNGNIDKFDWTKKQFNRIIKREDRVRFRASLNYYWGSIGITIIGQLQCDEANLLTIATPNFICKYDIKNNSFINSYKNFVDFLYKNNLGSINSYHYTREGDLWIGSARSGLYLVPNNESRILNYRNDPKDPGSLNSNKIFDIYEDRRGNIWIGTMGSGINKYDRNKQKFVYFEIETNNTYNSISVITEDLREKGRILWLGTSGIPGYELLKFDLKTGKIKKYQGHISSPIGSIYQDNKNLNTLWIGSMGSGLYKFDTKKEQLERIAYRGKIVGGKESFNYSISFVTSIVSAEKGYLWIGTLRGLFKLNTKTNRLIQFLHKPGNTVNLSDNNISVLHKSNYNNENVLWIGTRYGGLHRFNPEKMTIVNFRNDESDSHSLNDNYISSVYEDNSGTLWIGTPKGLNKFNRETMNFSHVMDKDRKLAVDITGILEDKKGNLWLNTNSGLFKYDPGTEKFKNYNKNDGLQISNFRRPASFKSKSGEMFFGADKGFITFHPDSIKENSHVPPVVLTDFQIFNKSVNPGENNSPLNQTIAETKEIILSHKQSVFSFEFAALDFTSPANNKYAYKMEGVDPDWVYTDASRRFATYTQLAPGEYIFRVKGSNNDGIWNETGTSVKMVILPPWWRTTWAYTTYLILFIILIYALRRYDLKRQRLKHELELEYVHAKKLEELDHMKSRFFANISHEFRTPLTLILGPVKQMLSGEFIGNFKEQYRMIIRNGERLLQLINQLLDLSKLESGKLKLQACPCDIVQYTRGLVQVFESLAVRKNIKLTFRSDRESLEAYLDRDKFEKIINNLLSNAFKFTPEGGSVIVDCGMRNADLDIREKSEIRIPKSDILQISISNTGPGIPTDQINKIFERFYQANDSYTGDDYGSGVGLTLTKELVEMHRGKITVESIPDKKTTFRVYLPIGKEHLDKDEIISEPLTPKFSKEEKMGTLATHQDAITKRRSLKSISDESRPIILIVEDNTDLRSYISGHLSSEYQTIEAKDGIEGLQKAKAKIPDLVISDVMMPRMDGYSLCKILKTDESTSHIPVILLTARAAKEDKIEGLETGADDYIAKPFDTDELRVRVKNLIEQRRLLRQRFRSSEELRPKEISPTSTDEKFLSKAVSIIEQNISDPEFTTSRFGRELALSRPQLHRKIKALTDQSPHMFIRLLRLRRAAGMLKNKMGNISEISYQVGFNSPAHFAKAFREEFGIAPSELTRKFLH